ncbi:hypothetical protein CDLVIII_3866 [Clostridium sp. DL-VIII]|nr:hypothetical protein CDLVIII_3866 [Clostridium sp. DL-VIII]
MKNILEMILYKLLVKYCESYEDIENIKQNGLP